MVIFFHGNGETIEMWSSIAEKYNDLGFNVLLPEYRGYGNSGGKPSVENIVSDTLYFMREIYDVNTTLILHGRSIGGCMASNLTQHCRVDGLITESVFSSLSSVIWSYFLPGFIVGNKMNNLQFLKKFKNPILVIHGKRDTIIPFSHANTIVKNVDRPSTHFVDNAGHNNLFHNGAYWNKVISWLNTL